MITFIVRRLTQAVPLVLLSTLAVFLLIRAVPGDPALIVAGPDAKPDVIAAVRLDLGLDRPLPIQYAIWLGNMLSGDFGLSYTSRLPVSELIAQRFPATVQLAVAAIALALLMAVPSGVLAALHQGKVWDWIVSFLSALAIAVPNFWLGILFIMLFALFLGWLPPGGRVDPATDIVAAGKYLLLPAFALALGQAATMSRFVRASVVEVLEEEYIRTARAKGLPEKLVVRRHALRNSLVPLVTVLGIQFGRLLGGAIVIESVFSWPGLGTLILRAIGTRDYLVVQASLLLLVVIFLSVNLLTDLTYGYLDPRIRVGKSMRR